MNESVADIHTSDSSPQQALETTTATNVSDPPEFGLVDVVEAFTAMRHEYRLQTRESRELATSLQAAATHLGELESQLTRQLSVLSQDDVGRSLALVIAEIDIHLTRAASATAHLGTTRHSHGPDTLATVQQAYDQLNFVSRWFCRKFHESTRQALQADTKARRQEKTSAEGIAMVASRLRRMMAEHQIERVGVDGAPFDAECMHAIEAIMSNSQPSGHVIQELAPAYYWRGQLLRYAEVRVAQ